MPEDTTLERRLTALEREVAQIKLRLSAERGNENWVDAISGSMKPFAEFEEVVRLGRELRQSTTDPKN